jgi:hypothetical protein
METKKRNCTGMEAKLAGMLLDPNPAPAKVQTHVAECSTCQGELDELKATMDLLDAWQAPEPNPYFLTRLGARMREERQAAPVGWFASSIARLRASIAYGSGLHARPLAAVTLAVMLLVGGGTYLGVSDVWMQTPQASPQANVVHDLQTLDENAQVLDQLQSLSNGESGD